MTETKTTKKAFPLVELPPNMEDEGFIVNMMFYKKSMHKFILFVILSIISGGFIFILSHWILDLQIILTLSLTTNVEECDCILIKSADGNQEIVQLYKKKGSKNISLVLDMENEQFHEKYFRGIDSAQLPISKEIYGINSTKIPEKPCFKIFMEILSPFFLFQIFSCTLWFCNEYELYAGVIMFTTLTSIIITLYEQSRNIKNLRNMSSFEIEVNVYRNLPKEILLDRDTAYKVNILNYKQKISSHDLVPGDLIEIPEDNLMPADIILLNGTCIMNESMLTGESIPVMKTGLPINNLKFNIEDETKNSLLVSGTKCIESRYGTFKKTFPVLGIVFQTGFETTKGKLVRSILFPKPNSFNFFKDSLKFISAMGLLSLIGLGWTIYNYLKEEEDAKEIAMACLDMITIIIPPALPTCMSVGIAFALSRLREKNIFCISPNKINVAGKIDIMCFDKTGTLTEDGLEMHGVLSVNCEQDEFKFSKLQQIENLSQSQEKTKAEKRIPLQKNSNFLYQENYSHTLIDLLSCCHSLTRVGSKLIGDPLDIIMFEATNYNLIEGEDITEDIINKDAKNFIAVAEAKGVNKKIGILKRFDFSSKLQRMSVILENLTENNQYVFVKGSPEKIRELCLVNSIPKDFHRVLDEYAKKGLRILACAGRNYLPLKHLSALLRDDVENELTFLGFLIMENKIKNVTPSIIEKLHQANIRTIMVTGDNLLTAISVSKTCNLIKSNERVYHGELKEGLKQDQFSIRWFDFDRADDKLTKQLTQKGAENQRKIKKKSNDDKKCKSFRLEKVEEGSPSTLIKKHQTQNDEYSEEILLKHLNKEDLEARSQILPALEEDTGPLFLENQNFCLALTGSIFSVMVERMSSNTFPPHLYYKILEKCNIFARMKPNEKALLITELQKMKRNMFVGMCGDGANDCGALNAADVGISLSEAEASIAAPFTSKIQDISCVVELFKEGRCALVTSLQCFKYMMMYSMIQFTTVCILHGAITSLSNNQFMWVDLATIFPIAVLMGYTKPYERLSALRPVTNLISFPVLSSILGQMFIQIFTLGLLYSLTIENFKICKELDSEFYCYENTNLFLVSNFQYITTVLAFSIGPPFRQQLYKNYLFASILFALTVVMIYLVLYPADYLRDVVPIMIIDWDWKGYLLAFAGVNCIITFLYEKFALNLVINLWYKYGKRTRKEENSIKANNEKNEKSNSSTPIKVKDIDIEMNKL